MASKTVSMYESSYYAKAFLWVLSTASIYMMIVFVLALLSTIEIQFVFDKYYHFSTYIYVGILVAFLYLYPIYVMVFIRPSKLFKYIGTGVRKHLFSRERFFFSFPILILIPLVQSVYSSFKYSIPQINDFQYDELFFSLDRILFGGVDPWTLLQPILGYPEITIIVDFLYHTVWFVLMLFAVMWHALGSHDLYFRVRFFVTYILIWAILGNLAALVLSSAGPCYYDSVTSLGNPYSPLFNYLNLVDEIRPLNSLKFQDKLWQGHIDGVLGHGGGISAMPSIHIATTTLFALSFKNINKLFANILFIYMTIIFIGSIHLGWHYAVDGIFSFFSTLLIWVFVGWLLEKVNVLGCNGNKVKNDG